MKIQRKELELIARNSDLTSAESDQLFNIYLRPNESEWSIFFKYFLLIMGLGLLGTGIIFFFAYNWESLPKWLKLSIPLFLISLAIVLALILNANKIVYNLLLTFASLLVGAFLAVFGQSYQTGAFAYELFFAWNLLIIIWCFVADFEGTWLLFIVILHTAISLYINYYMTYIMGVYEWIFHSLVSILYNVIFYYRSFAYNRSYYSWFRYLIFVAMIILITITTSVLFFDFQAKILIPFMLILCFNYYFYYNQAMNRRMLTYLAFVLLSLLVIGSSLILSIGEINTLQVFFVLALNAIFITFGIKYLRKLQNGWND